MADENLILIDTNVLIEYMKNNGSTILEINRIGKDNISISIITYCEILFGARNKSEFNKISKYLDSMRILRLTEDISIIFKELFDRYYCSHYIDIPDALIAATSIVNHIPLFTYNLKDFKFIENLQIYNSH
jgi:tRNA(fMet)-specific endonuclease VapC